jgi:uncharacterized protein
MLSSLRSLALSLACALFCVTANAATPNFPELTGRVVDNAHILSPEVKEALRQELADYERGTTNQIVVLTLPSLDGIAIEDYGYQLLRKWGIGQKDKNNGAVLIIVPSNTPGKSRARIEAGYGLEGTLTDAISSQIINGIIAPAFKLGDTARGVIEGTEAIISVLGGNSVHVASHQQQSGSFSVFHMLLALVLLVMFIRNPSFFMWMLLDDVLRSGGGSSRGSGWGGGDNFRGGGGSAGGGGASGSW